LFTLGLHWWQQHFAQHRPVPLPTVLADWQAPTWAVQITGHHAKAYVFAKRD
jgi:hypothetical protein